MRKLLVIFALGASVVAATPFAGLIFADGFESGNLSPWSIVVSSQPELESASLAVTPAAAMEGSFGLEVLMDGVVNSAFAQDDSPSYESVYRASFLLDPNSVSIAEGEDHVVFEAFGTNGTVLALRLGFKNGSYTLRLDAIQDDGSTVSIPNDDGIAITDLPHEVQAEFASATFSCSNDGLARLSVDGAPAGEAMLNNHTKFVDSQRLGAVADIDLSTVGSYYLDTFQSFRTLSPLAPPRAAALATPQLCIPGPIRAAAGEDVVVPVEFFGNGNSIASVVFSLDYDPACLDFDLTDADLDGVPDAVDLQVSADFDVSVFFDDLDSDGEIDVTVTDFPPEVAVADGALANFTFTTICVPPPPPGNTLSTPVLFSSDPAPSFGDLNGQDIPGTATGNSVEILGGLRGDCNGDSFLSAGDLGASGLEIFDLDGNSWLNTPGSTFTGNPVGCDANADTLVDAGDLSCTSRLFFALACSPSPTRQSSVSGGPWLSLPAVLEVVDGKVRVPVRLRPAGHSLSSLAFSLDFNPNLLRFDETDGDGDGLPDTVHFMTGSSTRSITVDLSDPDGELDFLVNDLNPAPQILVDGLLVEIEMEYLGSSSSVDGGIVFSSEPTVSFGTATGSSIPGRSELVLFDNGFESGDTELWSHTVQ